MCCATHCDSHRGQKRVLGPVELESRVVGATACEGWELTLVLCKAPRALSH